MSRESAVDYMNLYLEPDAVYADVGIGGNEYFDVSETVYLGVVDFNSFDSENPDAYSVSGPYRFQVREDYSDGLLGPIDVLGVPVMTGKIVVLNSGSTNNIDFFMADIKNVNDTNIPETDFKLPLIFEKYVFPEDPINIGPYPTLAYNPLIPNITIDHNGVESVGDYLLDTGAMISMISIEQGVRLGLTDQEGLPIVNPSFMTEVGGVGGSMVVWGFTIDELKIPTNKGFDLVYKNARLAVADISVYDSANDELITLEGIFGSNFLCATSSVDFSNASTTPYDWIVIDMNEGYIGFDVADDFPVPRDSYHISDLINLSDNWLIADCNYANNYCNQADFNMDGTVNLLDHGELVKWWQRSRSAQACGSANKPFVDADYNRDCKIDVADLLIFSENWLKQCDTYSFNCKYTDTTDDGFVDFSDFAKSAGQSY